MRHRRLAVSVGVMTLAAGGVLLAQHQPPAPPALPAVSELPPAAKFEPGLLVPAANPPAIPVPPLKPDDLTIEQLLEAVDRVQTQKAELERRERELLQALRVKADRLRERLTKLGVGEPPAVAAPALPPAGPAK